MSPPFLFVLMSFFAYRLYRLIGRDDLTERPRRWLVGQPGSYGELFLTCSWCAGAWLSFGTVAVVAQATNVPLPILQAGAVSCVVGFLGQLDN